MSYETVMTAAKIIATAHPIARGVCKCDTPADVSFKDVASTLLDSGWESVLIADKNLLIANTDVARNDYVNAHPKSKFTIYRRQIDKHGIPRKVTEVWGVKCVSCTRTVWLIDTENVQKKWLNVVHFKTKKDKLIIFIGPEATYMSLKELQVFLAKYPVNQVEFCVSNAGKNSMDFHVVAKLGSLCTTGKKSNYIIVSADKGYDGLIQTMCSKGLSVKRIACEAVIPHKETKNHSTSVRDNKDAFCTRLQKLCVQQKIDAENMKQIIDAARSISAPYKKNFIERVNPKISRAGVGNAQNAAHAAALMRAVKKEIYPMLA